MNTHSGARSSPLAAAKISERANGLEKKCGLFSFLGEKRGFDHIEKNWQMESSFSS
jgi:hypothetical protein